VLSGCGRIGGRYEDAREDVVLPVVYRGRRTHPTW
jgi:hypothetical protein